MTQATFLNLGFKCAISIGFGVLLAGGAGYMASQSFAEAHGPKVSGAPHYLATCVNYDIATQGRNALGTAEFAATDQDRAYGMMFRTELADREAMIFDMDLSQNVVFWMKNTPSPLDIIFFDEAGQLAHIVSPATPYSTENVGPDPFVTVSYVLEMPAGSADRLGLSVGQSDLRLSAPFECPADLRQGR